MNAHSVAKLYFIKNDPANVRESSVLILVQEIVALNFFATLLCDKSKYFLLFLSRRLEFSICAVEGVPCRPDRIIVEVDDVIRTLDDLATWRLNKPDGLDSCDLIVIVSDFAY